MYDYILKAKAIYPLNGEDKTLDWIGVKDKKIACLGKGDVPEGETVKEYNGVIIPGLSDSHTHCSASSVFKYCDSLMMCTCLQDIFDIIAAKAESTEGDWLLFHSLMVPYLAEQRWPDRWELDAVSKGKKVVIAGYDMHGSVFNTAALDSIEIDPDEFGVEKRDGEVTGQMASDDAHFRAFQQYMDQLDRDVYQEMVDGFIQECVFLGLTTVHALEGGFFPENMDVGEWTKRAADEKTPLHVVVYPQVWDYDLAAKYNLPRYGGCLTLDGSDMNYTMAMDEVYDNNPSTRGFLMRKDADLYELVSRAHADGKQCAFHALGERAIDQILYIYDQVIAEQGDKGLRHRIEHFTMAKDDQIAHAKKLGCVVVPQPEVSLLFTEPSVEAQFGAERTARMERYKVWTDAGLIVGGGSDSPIGGISPFGGLNALINNPVETRRLDIDEALRYYTYNVAYAAHEEHERGMIQEGFYADFTVLDRDPYAEPENIGEFKALATISEGRIVYEA